MLISWSSIKFLVFISGAFAFSPPVGPPQSAMAYPFPPIRFPPAVASPQSFAYPLPPITAVLPTNHKMMYSFVSNAWDSRVDFPVFINDRQRNSHTFIRVRGNWTAARNLWSVAAFEPCASIVERPEICSVQGYHHADLVCESIPLWAKSKLSYYLGFEIVNSRLASHSHFAAGQQLEQSAHNHSICIWIRPSSLSTLVMSKMTLPAFRGNRVISALVRGPKVVGKVVYASLPHVHFLEDAASIGVRTFLNPGWERHLRIPCVNCSAANRIALQPVVLPPRCLGASPYSQIVSTVVAAARASEMPKDFVEFTPHFKSDVPEVARREGAVMSVPKFALHLSLCPSPAQTPCGGYYDDAFKTAEPLTDPEGSQEVVFGMSTTRRYLTSERKLLYHHRSAICFYPHEGLPHGWLIGFASLHMDGPDMQAFVVAVCFFGVVLPLICMVTGILHIVKQERCKRHVQIVQLRAERDRLRTELGLEPEDHADHADSDATTTSRGGSARLEAALHRFGFQHRMVRPRSDQLSALREAAYLDVYGSEPPQRVSDPAAALSLLDEQLEFLNQAIEAASVMQERRQSMASSSSATSGSSTNEDLVRVGVV